MERVLFQGTDGTGGTFQSWDNSISAGWGSAEEETEGQTDGPTCVGLHVINQSLVSRAPPQRSVCIPASDVSFQPRATQSLHCRAAGRSDDGLKGTKSVYVSRHSCSIQAPAAQRGLGPTDSCWMLLRWWMTWPNYQGTDASVPFPL